MCLWFKCLETPSSLRSTKINRNIKQKAKCRLIWATEMSLRFLFIVITFLKKQQWKKISLLHFIEILWNNPSLNLFLKKSFIKRVVKYSNLNFWRSSLSIRRNKSCSHIKNQRKKMIKRKEQLQEEINLKRLNSLNYPTWSLTSATNN